MPEGEKQQLEVENLFEQIMKENFPNLVKEIDFQEVQGAQRVPKRNTPRHIIIRYPRLKIENLESSKRKGDHYLQRSAHKVIS